MVNDNSPRSDGKAPPDSAVDDSDPVTLMAGGDPRPAGPLLSVEEVRRIRRARSYESARRLRAMLLRWRRGREHRRWASPGGTRVGVRRGPIRRRPGEWLSDYLRRRRRALAARRGRTRRWSTGTRAGRLQVRFSPTTGFGRREGRRPGTGGSPAYGAELTGLVTGLPERWPPPPRFEVPVDPPTMEIPADDGRAPGSDSAVDDAGSSGEVVLDRSAPPSGRGATSGDSAVDDADSSDDALDRVATGSGSSAPAPPRKPSPADPPPLEIDAGEPEQRDSAVDDADSSDDAVLDRVATDSGSSGGSPAPRKPSPVDPPPLEIDAGEPEQRDSAVDDSTPTGRPGRGLEVPPTSPRTTRPAPTPPAATPPDRATEDSDGVTPLAGGPRTSGGGVLASTRARVAAGVGVLLLVGRGGGGRAVGWWGGARSGLGGSDGERGRAGGDRDERRRGVGSDRGTNGVAGVRADAANEARDLQRRELVQRGGAADGTFTDPDTGELLSCS